MGIFQYVATLSGASGVFTSQITDLDLIETEAGTRLYAVTRVDGGMSAWDPTGSGAAMQLSEQAFRSNYGRIGDPDLVMVRVDGTSYLLPAAIGDTSNSAFFISDDTGAILSRVRFNDGVEPASDALIFTTLTVGGRPFVVSVSASQGHPAVYEATNTRSLELHYSGASADPARVEALTSVIVNGQPIVLVATGTSTTLTAYLMDEVSGALRVGGTIDMSDGIGFQGFAALSTAQIGNLTYIIAAGAGSSSLTVFSLSSNGSMVPVDHAVDMLETRFATASIVESFTYGDQVFVLAAGGDDGVSLFQMLPDGHLIYLESIGDSSSLPLDNISAIAVDVINGQPRLFVASATEAGIAQFTLTLGARGVTASAAGQVTGTAQADLLIAAVGTTQISGGAGDDLLVASGQSLTMIGGAGADRFVMLEPAGRVVIRDFARGSDLIDLSTIPMLYSDRQLQITQQDWGAEIRLGSLVIVIETDDFNPLTEQAISSRISFGAAHYDPILPPQTLIGTAQSEAIWGGNRVSRIIGLSGNDTLSGGLFSDTISGEEGDDLIDGGESGDLLIGDSGDDSLIGGGGNDTLAGGEGNDVISGGAEEDLIYGGRGHDNIEAGHGNDTVHGEAGDDTIRGSAGDDLLIGGDGDDMIYGGYGNDRLFGGAGRNALYGEYGHDILRGGDGHETLDGGEGNDTMLSGGGNDLLIGGAGDDILRGQTGNDRLFGNAGDDRLYGDQGDDSLDGGAGHDVLVGGDGNDTIFGGFDNDSMVGAGGHDVVVGGDGDDRMTGDDGNDRLYGNSGDDGLRGGNGNDTLDGGEGNDTLNGGLGADLVLGSGGNDLIAGSAGHDTLEGGIGNDTIRGEADDDHINGDEGNDILFGNNGNDTILGGEGDGADMLYGDAGNDLLYGNAGNDSLRGGMGNDRLDGGAGNDVLWGEQGRDTLTGGLGGDRFIFTSATHSGAGDNADTITDFVHNVDKVDLSALRLTWIGGAAFEIGQENALRFVMSGGAGHLQADFDGDGRVDFEIHFEAAPLVTLSDLIL